jgi:hypothetical protein
MTFPADTVVHSETVHARHGSRTVNARRYGARLAVLAMMLSAASGCTQTETKPDMAQCTEPRPEVCTMDYTPVCALRTESGTEQWKTYANACTACSDAAVTGYRENACPEDEQN